MKLLLDQDVYKVTLQFLRSFEYDVLTVAEIGYSQESDEKLLEIARKQKRIFITRDRDFGSLVFVKKIGTGVIYLRMIPLTIDKVHQELYRILSAYSEEELNGAFVVVESGRHRFRKLMG
jgi:predicted nuclease of predicted toxin-antitoxin system